MIKFCAPPMASTNASSRNLKNSFKSSESILSIISESEFFDGEEAFPRGTRSPVFVVFPALIFKGPHRDRGAIHRVAIKKCGGFR